MMDTSNNNSPASPGREGVGGGDLEDDTTATVHAQLGRRGGQVGERASHCEKLTPHTFRDYTPIVFGWRAGNNHHKRCSGCQGGAPVI